MVMTLSIVLCLGSLYCPVNAVQNINADREVVLTLEKDAAEAVSAVAQEEAVDIQEEETPLAVRHCKAHWAILVLTFLYTCYAIIRANSRGKRLRNLRAEGKGSTAKA